MAAFESSLLLSNASPILSLIPSIKKSSVHYIELVDIVTWSVRGSLSGVSRL